MQDNIRITQITPSQDFVQMLLEGFSVARFTTPTINLVVAISKNGKKTQQAKIFSNKGYFDRLSDVRALTTTRSLSFRSPSHSQIPCSD